MNQWIVQAGKSRYPISVAQEDGVFNVLYENKTYRIDAQKLWGTTWSLLIDDQSVLVDVYQRNKKNIVVFHHQELMPTFEDAQLVEFRKITKAQTITASTQDTIVSPMTGEVVRVLVKSGDVIAENDCAIIICAMKTENEIRTTSSGTVADIFVSPGQIVSLGDQLFRLK